MASDPAEYQAQVAARAYANAMLALHSAIAVVADASGRLAGALHDCAGDPAEEHALYQQGRDTVSALGDAYRAVAETFDDLAAMAIDRKRR